MLFSFITPTAFIEKFSIYGDFTLALSYLISLKKETKYEKKIKEVQFALPILLDNGLFEHHKPESVGTLISKAVKVNAYGFFSPDYLYDTKKTKQQIDATYTKLIKRKLVGKIKLGAVVQADNKEDWIQQYIDFTQDKRIDLIGLSILSIPKSFGGSITESRITCMKELLKLDLKRKDCHLLGLGESYDDVKFAIRNCPFIKSNDSSSCFMTGLKGKVYTKDMKVPGGKIKEKLDFDLDELSLLEEEAIYKNIRMVKQLQDDN